MQAGRKGVRLTGGVTRSNGRFALRGEDVTLPAFYAPEAEQRCEEDEPT